LAKVLDMEKKIFKLLKKWYMLYSGVYWEKRYFGGSK